VGKHRPTLNRALEEVGVPTAEGSGMIVSRVPKSQHRKPPLFLTYQAVKNVLGEDAERRVKDDVKRDRLARADAAAVPGTLKIIPTNKLRKARKDKVAHSPKPQKARKLKYVRKTAAADR
jgi:hypothetical protein